METCNTVGTKRSGNLVGEEDNTMQDNNIREQLSISREGKASSMEANAQGGTGRPSNRTSYLLIAMRACKCDLAASE